MEYASIPKFTVFKVALFSLHGIIKRVNTRVYLQLNGCLLQDDLEEFTVREISNSQTD
jgi:hypothetical protein